MASPTAMHPQPTLPVPHDVQELVKKYYEYLDDDQAVDDFAALFSETAELIIPGKVISGKQAIKEHKAHVIANNAVPGYSGKWQHDPEPMFASQLYAEAPWYMLHVNAFFTPGPESTRPSDRMDVAVRLQMERDGRGDLKMKFLQVYPCKTISSV